MSVSFFGQITSCAQGNGLHFDPAAYSQASKISFGEENQHTQIANVISKTAKYIFTFLSYILR